MRHFVEKSEFFYPITLLIVNTSPDTFFHILPYNSERRAVTGQVFGGFALAADGVAVSL
jgi:acyl-coenzyme A thioesterase PaaI-like protein